MDTPFAEALSPAAPVTYPDRSTGLVVFGIIQIVLGLFCALMVPLSFLGVFLARRSMGTALPAGSYVMSITLYALAAAFFIVLGVGSIRARRWGRDLTLITSWLWLVYGAVATVMLTVILPSSFIAGFRAAADKNPQAPPLPAGIAAVILTFMIAFFAVFLIILPIIFIAFFRRKDVQETCRRRDPASSWTERAPLPVLGASIVFGIAAFYSFQASFTVPMFPFFGKYLTGLPASALCLTVAVVDVLLSISLFKRQLAGWWIAVAALVLRTAALAITFRRGNLMEAYARMGWSSQQLELIQNSPMYRSGGVLWFGLVFMLLFLGYVIWIKRYFGTPDTAQPSSPMSYEPPASQEVAGSANVGQTE
jgi:hypothetical protein